MTMRSPGICQTSETIVFLTLPAPVGSISWPCANHGLCQAIEAERFGDLDGPGNIPVPE